MHQNCQLRTYDKERTEGANKQDTEQYTITTTTETKTVNHFHSE